MTSAGPSISDLLAEAASCMRAAGIESPRAEARWNAPEVEAGMDALIQIVGRVRAMRTETGIPPKAKVDLFLHGEPETVRFLSEQALLSFLARVEKIGTGVGPEGSRRDVVAGVEIALVVEKQEMSPMADAERKRLAKELEKLEAEISRSETRLSDEQFLAKAPPHVVANGRATLTQMQERRSTLRSTLGL